MPIRCVNYPKQEETSVYTSYWEGAPTYHQAGGRELPSAPHPMFSSAWQISAVQPMGSLLWTSSSPTPPFP